MEYCYFKWISVHNYANIADKTCNLYLFISHFQLVEPVCISNKYDVAEPLFPAMAAKGDKVPSFPRIIVSPEPDAFPVIDRGIVFADEEHFIIYYGVLPSGFWYRMISLLIASFEFFLSEFHVNF